MKLLKLRVPIISTETHKIIDVPMISVPMISLKNKSDIFPRLFLFLFSKLHVDNALIFALLENAISLIVKPITAALIIFHFTKELQGFYYTFNSLLVMRFFAEIGLGQAIIQFASHEWALLRLDDKKVVGDRNALNRLRNITIISMRWYLVSTIIGLPIIYIIGHTTFSTSLTSSINWSMPWLALCLISGISFLFTPLFSIIQGCGQVAQFWFYRFIVTILSAVSLWLAILFNFKLWACSLSVISTLLWGIIFLFNGYTSFFKSIFNTSKETTSNKISWSKEIWPVQWRIGFTWLSANFLPQFFTIIAFRLDNPIVAGQIGLTVSLSMVVCAISSNWLITKAPHFGTIIAKKRFQDLDRLFFRSMFVSIIVSLFIVVTISVLVVILNKMNYSLATRILPPLPTFLFLLASTFNSITIGFSTYLRAHKKEPLVPVYVAVSLITIISSIIFVTAYGAVAIPIIYFFVVSTLQFPMTLIVFFKCRKKWHENFSN